MPVEIVNTPGFPGTEQWREDTIGSAFAWYSSWISSARQLKYAWNELAADKAWEKTFEDEPKTEERFRKEKLDVRDEAFWKVFLDLIKLMDQDRAKRENEEKERAMLQKEAQECKRKEIKNRRRLHRRKLRPNYTDSELNNRVDGILCADYRRNERNYKYRGMTLADIVERLPSDLAVSVQQLQRSLSRLEAKKYVTNMGEYWSPDNLD